MASIGAKLRRLAAFALLGTVVHTPGASAEVITEFAPFRYDTERPEVLELAGAIGIRTGVLFKLALAEFPEVTTLSLASGGGSIYVALPAAYDVRAAGLKTTIPEGETCASSCTYLFFAGVERSAEGRLGVHRIDIGTDSLTAGQVTLGDIFKAFEDFGVPTPVISRMMRTPTESMYLYDPLEMEKLGLLGPVDGLGIEPEPAPAPAPVANAEPNPVAQPPRQDEEPEIAAEEEPVTPAPVTPTEPPTEPPTETVAEAEEGDGLDTRVNALNPAVAACFDAAIPWENDIGWPGIRSKQIVPPTAIPKCEAALRQAPDNVWVSISLARSLGEAGLDARAVALYEPIAAAGNAFAKGSLGVFYLNGRGVGKNPSTAYRLFTEAAAEGNPTAHFALAVIHAFPSHTIANDTQAAIDHAYEALAAGEDRSPQIYRDMARFPHSLRVGVQRRLQREGFYSGALDGSFGPASWAAARLLALSRQAEG